MAKTRKEKPPGPRIESPTWGQTQRMAAAVLEALGGPKGAADKLSWESFYCLSLLASLRLDKEKAAAHLLGRQWIT